MQKKKVNLAIDFNYYTISKSKMISRRLGGGQCRARSPERAENCGLLGEQPIHML